MKYLRFGKIPEIGKSINFFKMTNQQVEDFTFCIEIDDIEQAYKYVPTEAYEIGLSAFEMNSDGFPVINNMRSILSLCARLEEPIFLVDGEKVGEGNDGEPLITAENVEPIEIEKEELIDLILKTLKRNFKIANYNSRDDFGDNMVFDFHIGDKIEYCFNGWTFSDPVNGFATSIGFAKRV